MKIIIFKTVNKQTYISPLHCFNQIFFFLGVLCKLGWKRKSHFLIRIMSCLSFHVIFQSLSRNLMLHSSLCEGFQQK